MSDLAKEAAKWIRETKRGAARNKPEMLLEAALGRKLEDYETALFKDGNSSNLAPDNLLVGFKAGVDYRLLTCRNCGARVIGLQEG